MEDAIKLREAGAADTDSIAALATLVFLDTYAPEGLRGDLAREAFSGFSPAAFAARLQDEHTAFVLAESDGHLVGFVELAQERPVPGAAQGTLEVVRLYVHPRFQRKGIGKALLVRAESFARDAGTGGIWLSAWAGNARALGFYDSLGYRIVGKLDHVIEGTPYANHVLAKDFSKESTQ